MGQACTKHIYTHDLMSSSQQLCEGVGESPPLHRGGDQAHGGYIVGLRSQGIVLWPGRLAHILSLDPLQRINTFFGPA